MEQLSEIEFERQLTQIRECADTNEVLRFIKQLKTIKAALDSMNTFYEQAVKYAILHVQALIRVCELGGIDRLYGLPRSTALWLSNMSEEERNKYISMCKDGLTIYQIYKREVIKPKDLKQGESEVKIYREKLLSDLIDYGIADMSGMSEHLAKNTYLDKELIPDYIDGTRNILLRAGAVGVGNNTGLYVKPMPCNSKEVRLALITRLKSIMADLENMSEIANVSGVKLGYSDVKAFLTTKSDSFTHGLITILQTFNIVKKMPPAATDGNPLKMSAERTKL